MCKLWSDYDNFVMSLFSKIRNVVINCDVLMWLLKSTEIGYTYGDNLSEIYMTDKVMCVFGSSQKITQNLCCRKLCLITFNDSKSLNAFSKVGTLRSMLWASSLTMNPRGSPGSMAKVTDSRSSGLGFEFSLFYYRRESTPQNEYYFYPNS